MRQKYFIDAFAFSGDQTPVPDATDPSGFVSYTQGYTFDYERLLDGSDLLAKFPTRQNMNYLLYELHLNVQQYQQNGVPEFITSTNNGGTPFTYGAGAQVLYSASGNPPFTAYISLVDGNADMPPSSKWLAIIPALIWHDLTSVRILNTTYTNTNPYPISVSVVVTVGSGGPGQTLLEVTVDGNMISAQNTQASITLGTRFCTYFQVPAGQTYKVGVGGSITSWYELFE